MLIFDNGVYNGGEPGTDDLDVLRKIVKGYIDAFAADKRIKLAGVPSPEYAAWGLKLAEAQVGGGVILDAEASARGITTDELVKKVLANATAYQQAESWIAGTAGKMRDATENMTREQLIEFDWRF